VTVRPEQRYTVGPLGDRVGDVRRIAIVRGGGIGDLMGALPAITSLSDAYPGAEVVLFGTHTHAALMNGRPSAITSARILPAAKGVYEPTGQAPALADFLAEARAMRFDLAVQLHGGGRWSNPFTRSLDARITAGLCDTDAEPLDRSVPYRYYQHEVHRYLEVVGTLGAPPTCWQLTLAVTDDDLAAAAEVLDGEPGPLVAVHPGATDPRRRWPPERFGQVVADAGVPAVVVGTTDETELADEVVRASGGRARSLAGRLSLPALLGVLARSRVVLANDSGPRHLAQALGTPTVAVFWIGNLVNAGPFGRSEHRPHVSTTSACPVCATPCMAVSDPRCGHDVSFVADVSTADVAADVVELLQA
jgi:ADP-heptose:LPS heptosyltransferase